MSTDVDKKVGEIKDAVDKSLHENMTVGLLLGEARRAMALEEFKDFIETQMPSSGGPAFTLEEADRLITVAEDDRLTDNEKIEAFADIIVRRYNLR